jgi:chromate transporter
MAAHSPLGRVEAITPGAPIFSLARTGAAPHDRFVRVRIGRASEVFAAFLLLGLRSFGGPIAHLAYFRRELVERRRWVDESQYAQLVGICQFLPGPASSQLGFSLGLLRAGFAGAGAAVVAFTLPSAVLMLAFAGLLPHVTGPVGAAALHGLQLVALSVVADGVLRMGRRLTPDVPRLVVAGVAAALALASGLPWVQLFVVGLGAAAGLALCRRVPSRTGDALAVPYGPRLGWTLLGLFAVVLVGLPILAHGRDDLLAVAAAFYRAGSLVFGGAHVVLPLLEETVVEPGWIALDDFLAGYGMAQAMPGPMFSLAAYLGARLPDGQGGVLGAAVALGAIYLPGLLLVAGILPLWRAVAGRPDAARAIAGVNAAVVGLLAAALYDPIWMSAVRGPLDIAIAAVGFVLLAAARVPALAVVLWCVTASVAGTMLRP